VGNPDVTAWVAAPLDIRREGDTIIIRIPGDWAVTTVGPEYGVVWPLDSRGHPPNDGVEATYVQLQPRKGGP
jgi:hypothetical protein